MEVKNKIRLFTILLEVSASLFEEFSCDFNNSGAAWKVEDNHFN